MLIPLVVPVPDVVNLLPVGSKTRDDLWCVFESRLASSRRSPWRYLPVTSMTLSRHLRGFWVNPVLGVRAFFRALAGRLSPLLAMAGHSRLGEFSALFGPVPQQEFFYLLVRSFRRQASTGFF